VISVRVCVRYRVYVLFVLASRFWFMFERCDVLKCVGLVFGAFYDLS
jgi:hypothetical protein